MDVVSVAFQAPGVKGWEDVVVRLRGGERRCYQVKHTRAEDTLTFGDLVQVDSKKQASLLGSLVVSWKSSVLGDGSTRCIPSTNREDGTWASAAGDVRRPAAAPVAQLPVPDACHLKVKAVSAVRGGARVGLPAPR